jgi:hypothetical protein
MGETPKAPSVVRWNRPERPISKSQPAPSTATCRLPAAHEIGVIFDPTRSEARRAHATTASSHSSSRGAAEPAGPALPAGPPEALAGGEPAGPPEALAGGEPAGSAAAGPADARKAPTNRARHHAFLWVFPANMARRYQLFRTANNPARRGPAPGGAPRRGLRGSTW